MDFGKYVAMQRKLDAYIEERHPRRKEASRLREKTLAAIIEIAELMNELPESFKFWSYKKNNMTRAFEEYVDVLHFLLSIAIEQDYVDMLSQAKPHNDKVPIREQALSLFDAAGVFIHAVSEATYLRMFEEFLALGRLIGVTEDILEETYMKKNAINLERQNNFY